MQSDKNKAANMAALFLNRRTYFVVEVVVLVLVLVESSFALETTTAASAAAPTPTATRVVVPRAAVPATPVEPAAVPATSSAANAFEERANKAARVNADFFITNFLI
ncbi:translation initiation factor III [Aeromonas veronii]|uniref:translation initiation factor III n=1 Tax=Aeromonas veronii TaxID=654 RepID=UPI000AA1B046|nr:translation initiation factor III [Aeromonas veronii]